MKHLIDLIASTFDLWVKMRWLKGIDKELRKRDKLWERYKRQRYVVNEMYKEFCKRYPDTVSKVRQNSDNP